MKNIAIILAGGSSLRFQNAFVTPKQYLIVNEKSLISYSIQAFCLNRKIDKVLVVIREQDLSLYQMAIDQLGNFIGKHKLLPHCIGGIRRQDSTYNGLQCIASFFPENVLIHDAARPFISQSLIYKIIEALEINESAIPTIAIADTVKHIENSVINSTLDRSKLYLTQTPQAFRFNQIEKLTKEVSFATQDFTDESSLYEFHGLKTHSVSGEIINYKISTTEEYELAKIYAKHFFKNTNEMRSGIGYDIHRFETDTKQTKKPLILGGIEISYDRYLHGHSDADVVLHAVTDALLGAIGESDIGTHFSNKNDKWKGVASTVFVDFAKQKVTESGFKISNLDIIIITEEPKIMPFANEIKTKIASILKIESHRIAIKSKTAEKIGSIGRKEGIEVFASVTLQGYAITE